MTKCKWCGEPAPEGRRFCDELCEKLDQSHEAQQGREGAQSFQKRRLTAHKNKVRSGRP